MKVGDRATDIGSGMSGIILGITNSLPGSMMYGHHHALIKCDNIEGEKTIARSESELEIEIEDELYE